MLENENPYQSPATDGPYRTSATEAPYRTSMRDAIAVFDDYSPLEVSVIRRGWLYRRIRLSGRISAVVQYDGRLIEKVRVNDETVFEQINWGKTLIPRLEFGLLGGNTRMPARIEVEGVVRLKAFRLFIGDTLVYADPSEPLE